MPDPDADEIRRAMTNLPPLRQRGTVIENVPSACQAGPGYWVVVAYMLSPKNRMGHLVFPMYWCDRHEWSAPDPDGDAPDGTLVWATSDNAYADLADHYPFDQPFRPGYMTYPSYDQRRRREV